MELTKGNSKLEELNVALNDDKFLADYKAQYDNQKIALLPKFLGNVLVFLGNLIYGKDPSYLKFRAVEIIARVPYYSWNSASYTLMTMFFANEKKAMHLSEVSKFSSFSQENETMHVVVISQLTKSEEKAGFIRHSFIPMTFAFFYFWWSYVLYLINPKYSYQLNYMFESHAFDQYDIFIKKHEHELKNKHIHSEFLNWYGRYPRTQYDFFLSVRNDELIHRNYSIVEISKIDKN